MGFGTYMENVLVTDFPLIFLVKPKLDKTSCLRALSSLKYVSSIDWRVKH